MKNLLLKITHDFNIQCNEFNANAIMISSALESCENVIKEESESSNFIGSVTRISIYEQEFKNLKSTLTNFIENNLCYLYGTDEWRCKKANILSTYLYSNRAYGHISDSDRKIIVDEVESLCVEDRSDVMMPRGYSVDNSRDFVFDKDSPYFDIKVFNITKGIVGRDNKDLSEPFCSEQFGIERFGSNAFGGERFGSEMHLLPSLCFDVISKIIDLRVATTQGESFSREKHNANNFLIRVTNFYNRTSDNAVQISQSDYETTLRELLKYFIALANKLMKFSVVVENSKPDTFYSDLSNDCNEVIEKAETVISQLDENTFNRSQEEESYKCLKDM